MRQILLNLTKSDARESKPEDCKFSYSVAVTDPCVTGNGYRGQLAILAQEVPLHHRLAEGKPQAVVVCKIGWNFWCAVCLKVGR
ncbi:hypothetical protein D3C79_964330 [compost metagenome]